MSYYSELNHVDMSDESIIEVFAKCDALQVRVELLEAENSKLREALELYLKMAPYSKGVIPIEPARSALSRQSEKK